MARFTSFIEKMIATTKAQAMQPEVHKSSLAEKVLDRISKKEYHPQHESKLRSRVTLESSVDELEKELRQEIARSLKQTEQKLVYKISVAEKGT